MPPKHKHVDDVCMKAIIAMDRRTNRNRKAPAEDELDQCLRLIISASRAKRRVVVAPPSPPSPPSVLITDLPNHVLSHVASYLAKPSRAIFAVAMTASSHRFRRPNSASKAIISSSSSSATPTASTGGSSAAAAPAKKRRVIIDSDSDSSDDEVVLPSAAAASTKKTKKVIIDSDSSDDDEDDNVPLKDLAKKPSAVLAHKKESDTTTPIPMPKCDYHWGGAMGVKKRPDQEMELLYRQRRTAAASTAASTKKKSDTDDPQWHTLDFGEVEDNLTAQLSDDDIRSILICIDAVNNLKVLNMKNLDHIGHRALGPLLDSIVLEDIDISDLYYDPLVVPTVQYIINNPNNSMRHARVYDPVTDWGKLRFGWGKGWKSCEQCTRMLGVCKPGSCKKCSNKCQRCDKYFCGECFHSKSNTHCKKCLESDVSMVIDQAATWGVRVSYGTALTALVTNDYDRVEAAKMFTRGRYQYEMDPEFEESSTRREYSSDESSASSGIGTFF